MSEDFYRVVHSMHASMEEVRTHLLTFRMIIVFHFVLKEKYVHYVNQDVLTKKAPCVCQQTLRNN